MSPSISSGSSGASPLGINVVMNYTHAYSTFAMRSCLNPELPNNHGSLAPIKVTAPEGSIVNAAYPSPLNARHVVGMFVPMPILKALHQVIPDARAGGRLGRGVDGADPGQEREWRGVHLVDVQLFRRHGRARDQARTQRHLLSRQAWPPCRWRFWKPRCRSCSIGASCAAAPAARAARAAATAR